MKGDFWLKPREDPPLASIFLPNQTELGFCHFINHCHLIQDSVPDVICFWPHIPRETQSLLQANNTRNIYIVSIICQEL